MIRRIWITVGERTPVMLRSLRLEMFWDNIDPTDRSTFVKLLEQTPVPPLDSAGLPDGWVNFYRRDDVSATVFLYLDAPSSDAAPLAPVSERIAGLQ